MVVAAPKQAMLSVADANQVAQPSSLPETLVVAADASGYARCPTPDACRTFSAVWELICPIRLASQLCSVLFVWSSVNLSASQYADLGVSALTFGTYLFTSG